MFGEANGRGMCCREKAEKKIHFVVRGICIPKS